MSAIHAVGGVAEERIAGPGQMNRAEVEKILHDELERARSGARLEQVTGQRNCGKSLQRASRFAREGSPSLHGGSDESGAQVGPAPSDNLGGGYNFLHSVSRNRRHVCGAIGASGN